MKFKPEVIKTDNPKILFAARVYEELRLTLGLGEATVTSMKDGTHNQGSLHTNGLAVDLRVKDIPEAKREGLFRLIDLALEPLGFDVVWEGGVGATPATSGAHIHIEFDPKGAEVELWNVESGVRE